MGRKNIVSADHYKNEGRGRQGDVAAANMHKHSDARIGAAASSAGKTLLPGTGPRSAFERRRRRAKRVRALRRSLKLKGLTAKQLMERRMSLRRADDDEGGR